MAVHNAHKIEKICTRIFTECKCISSWNWDDRFQAILSEIPAEKEKEVLPLLEKYFDTCWDDETIDFAPGKIKSVAKELGEVRQGQRLFCSNPEENEILLGAYWPWQNGKKVSLRILADLAEIELGMDLPGEQAMESTVTM